MTGVEKNFLKLTLDKSHFITGDREADEFCIGRLLPEKLQNQYCFKTVEALECLKFMEAEKIWLKK